VGLFSTEKIKEKYKQKISKKKEASDYTNKHTNTLHGKKINNVTRMH